MNMQGLPKKKKVCVGQTEWTLRTRYNKHTKSKNIYKDKNSSYALYRYTYSKIEARDGENWKCIKSQIKLLYKSWVRYIMNCQEMEREKLLFIRLHHKWSNTNFNSLKHNMRRDLDKWRVPKAHRGYKALIDQ